MPDLAQSQVLRNLHGALKLLIRGAAQELTEQCDVPQPKADILVLWAIVNELDNQVDLPTMLFAPTLDAIRISVENTHADAVDAARNTVRGAEKQVATARETLEKVKTAERLALAAIKETATIRARLEEGELDDANVIEVKS